ncbi:hypothetical protein AJ79_07004 [Helicocarpus griseus UAMH5409]|uniref:Uncharacterized protein n=1 Tax=Helicocarpus griseus UAMH5409 TaxID=1447875 RepID=A0A2B7X6Y4_9EURO|nr:hypothetical protein AJ79_07004 [Helicocarpus griseus UAMH5409]
MGPSHSANVWRDSNFHFFKYDVTSREGFNQISERYKTIFQYLYGKDPPREHDLKRQSRTALTTNSIWPKDPRTFTCFPHLPHELQLAILLECLTSTTPVSLPYAELSGININILLVCKLFYYEGIKIFWEQNIFTTTRSFNIIADTGFITPDRPRVVSVEEGEALANHFVADRFLPCKYVEMSFREDYDVFHDVVMDACEGFTALVARNDRLLLEDKVFGVPTWPTKYENKITKYTRSYKNLKNRIKMRMRSIVQRTAL